MKGLTALLIVTIFATIAFAQKGDSKTNQSAWSLPNAEAGIGLQVMIPTAAFQKNTGSIPVGLTGHYYHRVGAKFMLGGELSSACISHAQYDIELVNGEKATLNEDENMWGFMLGGRFNFIGNSAFRSYTEVRAGTNTFYTSISSCDKALKDYQKEQVHGTSFVSSIGVGLNLDPKAILKGEAGKAWVSLRGAYVAGTGANYRQAPESTSPLPINSNIYSSSIRYFELGWSVSWQFSN